MVSWRGGPDTRVYLSGDLGSVNEAGNWRRRGGVFSFCGEMSTLEESRAISAGASQFSYDASTRTNHTLISSSWSFMFCQTNLIFLGSDFRK